MNAFAEFIIASVIFFSSCGLYYVATTFPQSKSSDQVGPALWPKMILITLLILSGCLVIKNGRRILKLASGSEASTGSSKMVGGRMLMLTIALSLLYAFGVSYVGFLLSILIFQLLFLVILKVRNICTLTLYPICMTSVVYAIFIKVLYIPLPRGTGIFLTISRLFY